MRTKIKSVEKKMKWTDTKTTTIIQTFQLKKPYQAMIIYNYN